jgi:hypothetical protein
MRLCVLGALLAFLGGCALLEPAVDQVLEVDRLGGEAIAASRAPAAEQKVALTRAQQAFAADGRPMNRLRYATLLATLHAPLRDDARAAELLEPIADSNAPGIGRSAALLAGQLAERQRLARELERVARESERAARERAATDKERDKREEALRQQLEALRAIERGILEREENLRRRQR